MARIFLESEIDASIIKGKTIAVIGYGNQGRAQALNLRDSGFKVVIGAREDGTSWKRARKDGFEVYDISKAAEIGDVIMLLIPDMVQPRVYEEHIKPGLSEGKGICFAHGFNIHYGLIKPPKEVDVFMVAPKSPGVKVREAFLEGKGVPALVAVHNDYTGKALQKALAIAKGIGCARAGVILTTFKEETETDLIGEQCVLVGGLMELIKKGFEVLVELGYQPEVAYFEVCNEAKLIMDLIFSKGLSGMLRNVSETARYGGLTVGPKVIDNSVKERMKEAAKRVRDGSFAREWIEEYRSGMHKLERMLADLEKHQLEVVGKDMRKLLGLEG